MSRAFPYFLFLLTGLSCFDKGQAQSAGAQVIGAAGGSSKSVGAYTIDFTIGETVILTAGANPSCTEGFHQPLTAKDFPPKPDSNLTSLGWYIKVYPNPVHDQLTIHAYMDQAGQLDFRLIDIQGRVLQVTQMSFQKGYNDALLYLRLLSRGIYILYIGDQIHGGHREVKLWKE